MKYSIWIKATSDPYAFVACLNEDDGHFCVKSHMNNLPHPHHFVQSQPHVVTLTDGHAQDCYPACFTNISGSLPVTVLDRLMEAVRNVNAGMIQHPNDRMLSLPQTDEAAHVTHLMPEQGLNL